MHRIGHKGSQISYCAQTKCESKRTYLSMARICGKSQFTHHSLLATEMDKERQGLTEDFF